jgi:hypothetical protein
MKHPNNGTNNGTPNPLIEPENPITSGAASPATPSGTDWFEDLNNFRIPQNYETGLGVKKELSRVPVGKPAKDAWVRVNPDPAWRMEVLILEKKEKESVDKELYLIGNPHLHPLLANEPCVRPRLLVSAMSRQGVFFLWPILLPGPDGKVDTWSKSAMEAANLAQTHWVRLASNKALGAYEIYTASAAFPEPDWPDKPFAELLKRAFAEYLIVDIDHIVLKELSGRA